jgi:hypothetical protein
MLSCIEKCISIRYMFTFTPRGSMQPQEVPGLLLASARMRLRERSGDAGGTLAALPLCRQGGAQQEAISVQSHCPSMSMGSITAAII